MSVHISANISGYITVKIHNYTSSVVLVVSDYFSLDLVQNTKML